MLYDTIKCYVIEPLELKFKYITEPNVYDWKNHFETCKFKYKNSKYIEFPL